MASPAAPDHATFSAAREQTSPLDRVAAPVKYRRIQCLRFIAAAVVILFHAVGTGEKYFADRSVFAFAKHGDLGVDLFFVISGFIMVHTVNSREGDWRLFLRRRIQRIVPLYWLATLSMIVMLAVPGVSSTAPPDLPYITQSLFFLSWTDGRMPLVYPGWSMEYELVFYLVVTGSIALGRGTWNVALSVLSVSAVIGALFRAVGVVSVGGDFLTSAMFLEFALGIVVGLVVLDLPLPRIACALFVLAMSVTLIAPWSDRIGRLLVGGLPATALVLGAALMDRYSPASSRLSQIFERQGDASYSIYLVQTFTISIFCKAARLVWDKMPTDIVVIGCFLITLIVAQVIHRRVEKPIGRRLRMMENVRAPRAD